VTYSDVVQRIYKAGGALVSVTENLDFDTPHGRLLAGMLAQFAQFESETIGGRVKGAKGHLTAIGKWPGGRRPFGWTPVPHPDGKGFRLELDPVEGPVLRDMAEKVLGGTPVGAIAGDLNRRGIPTVLGHPWVGETVRKALTKPAMTGGNGADRLVSDRDYARLRGRLRRGAPSVARYEHDEVLLSPAVVTCGRCGSQMRPGTHDNGRRVYRCSQRPAPGTSGCFQIASATQVDALVERWFLDRMRKVPVAIRPEPEVIDPAAEERASIHERMAELEEDRYIRGLFAGPDGDVRFQRIYSSLEHLLENLPHPFVVEPNEPGIPTGEDTAEAWAAADMATRRSWLVAALRVEIAPGKGGRRLDPDRLTIRWTS
jgi:site-specific DNA recombinase